MFIFVASLFLHNRTLSDNCYDVQNVWFIFSSATKNASQEQSVRHWFNVNTIACNQFCRTISSCDLSFFYRRRCLCKFFQRVYKTPCKRENKPYSAVLHHDNA